MVRLSFPLLLGAGVGTSAFVVSLQHVLRRYIPGNSNWCVENVSGAQVFPSLPKGRKTVDITACFVHDAACLMPPK